MKRFFAAAFAAVFLLGGCSSPEPEGPGGSTVRTAVQSDELQFQKPAEGALTAVIETSKGTIQVALYPEYAPLAVENFCALAQQGAYNGTAFHRVMKDFVIQGGDTTGTGGQSAFGSPLLTERSDKLRHYSGALCMAPADSQPNTHQSQFYIVATPQHNLADEAALSLLREGGLREAVVETYRQAGGAPYLDNTDTVFGQVYAGMDVVDDIAASPVEEDGTTPKAAITVLSVSIQPYTAAGTSQSAPLSSSTSQG